MGKWLTLRRWRRVKTGFYYRVTL